MEDIIDYAEILIRKYDVPKSTVSTATVFFEFLLKLIVVEHLGQRTLRHLPDNKKSPTSLIYLLRDRGIIDQSLFLKLKTFSLDYRNPSHHSQHRTFTSDDVDYVEEYLFDFLHEEFRLLVSPRMFNECICHLKSPLFYYLDGMTNKLTITSLTHHDRDYTFFPIKVFDNTKGYLPVLDLLSSENYNCSIIGGPGFGKSTILKALFRKLAEDFHRGQNNKFPILIELKKIIESPSNIFDLIIDSLPSGTLNEHQLRYLAERGELILLVDAWDELIPDFRSSIASGLRLLGRNKNSIVISSREETKLPVQLKTIFLFPLSIPESLKYLLCRNPDSHDQYRKLISSLDEDLRTPLFLDLLSDINWIGGPLTRFSIMQGFFNNLSVWREGSAVVEHRAFLERLAYEYVTKPHRPPISRERVRRIVGSSRIEESFKRSGVLIFDGTSFTFFHDLMAEFLASCYIWNNWQDDTVNKDLFNSVDGLICSLGSEDLFLNAFRLGLYTAPHTEIAAFIEAIIGSNGWYDPNSSTVDFSLLREPFLGRVLYREIPEESRAKHSLRIGNPLQQILERYYPLWREHESWIYVFARQPIASYVGEAFWSAGLLVGWLADSNEQYKDPDVLFYPLDRVHRESEIDITEKDQWEVANGFVQWFKRIRESNNKTPSTFPTLDERRNQMREKITQLIIRKGGVSTLDDHNSLIRTHCYYKFTEYSLDDTVDYLSELSKGSLDSLSRHTQWRAITNLKDMSVNANSNDRKDTDYSHSFLTLDGDDLLNLLDHFYSLFPFIIAYPESFHAFVTLLVNEENQELVNSLKWFNCDQELLVFHQILFYFLGLWVNHSDHHQFPFEDSGLYHFNEDYVPRRLDLIIDQFFNYYHSDRSYVFSYERSSEIIDRLLHHPSSTLSTIGLQAYLQVSREPIELEFLLNLPVILRREAYLIIASNLTSLKVSLNIFIQFTKQALLFDVGSDHRTSLWILHYLIHLNKYQYVSTAFPFFRDHYLALLGHHNLYDWVPEDWDEGEPTFDDWPVTLLEDEDVGRFSNLYCNAFSRLLHIIIKSKLDHINGLTKFIIENHELIWLSPTLLNPLDRSIKLKLIDMIWESSLETDKRNKLVLAVIRSVPKYWVGNFLTLHSLYDI